MRPISSHLDQTNLVNKGFIWLLGKFCLRDTAGSPEQAFHLACSGSQSQRAIWFILPARGIVVLTFKSVVDETVVCGHQMKAIERYFHVVLFIMLYMVVLTFTVKLSEAYPSRLH